MEIVIIVSHSHRKEMFLGEYSFLGYETRSEQTLLSIRISSEGLITSFLQ